MGAELFDRRPVTRATVETLAEVGKEELASKVLSKPSGIFMDVLRTNGPTINVKHVVGADESRIESYSEQLLSRESEAIAVLEDYHNIAINAKFAGQLQLYYSFGLVVEPNLV